MTQEQKQLLLKDICARLPYGIIIYRITDSSTHRIQYSDITENIDQFSHFLECSGIDNIKPFLRPMSSMTEKEEIEYQNIVQNDGNWVSLLSQNLMDFFNKYHFDYRGLIPMGLALPAKEGMYNLK